MGGGDKEFRKIVKSGWIKNGGKFFCSLVLPGSSVIRELRGRSERIKHVELLCFNF